MDFFVVAWCRPRGLSLISSSTRHAACVCSRPPWGREGMEEHGQEAGRQQGCSRICHR